MDLRQFHMKGIYTSMYNDNLENVLKGRPYPQTVRERPYS